MDLCDVAPISDKESMCLECQDAAWAARQQREADGYAIWKAEQEAENKARAARAQAEWRAQKAAEEAARAAYAVECAPRITAFLQDKHLLDDHTKHVFRIHACEVHGWDEVLENEYTAIVPGADLSRAEYEVLAAIQYGMGTDEPYDEALVSHLERTVKTRWPGRDDASDPCTAYIDVPL